MFDNNNNNNNNNGKEKTYSRAEESHKLYTDKLHPKMLDTISLEGYMVKFTETRKPRYRKDDRAMRPIYGCPEKFRESSQTPPATFPKICKGLLFRSILRMCTQNLKFVALSVPEIIGGTQKIWAVP